MPKKFTAYVTLERLKGYCHLIILEEKGTVSKELKAHGFLLSFNYEGIKAYVVQKLIIPHRQYWEEKLGGYSRLAWPLALTLIEDAWRQNQRFGTPAAIEKEQLANFLPGDLKIDKGSLWRKLALGDLSVVEFVHLCLAALRRMDNALLYDLSSVRRQVHLGVREQFLLTFGEDLRYFTFLKSEIELIKVEGARRLVTAHIIVSTLEDKIMKLDYQLVLLEQGGRFYLDHLSETERQVLSKEHPANPINYRVFCSVYHFAQIVPLQKWLQSCPDVFLTGEFQGGTCYKLLRPVEDQGQGFNVFAGIACEFLLTENELFIYAQELAALAEREYLLVQALGEQVEFKQKYNLPIRQLYQAALQGLLLSELLKEEQVKDNFPIQSAWLVWQGSGSLCQLLRKRVKHYVQLDQTVGYFLQERKKEVVSSFIEYYVSGNWLRLNVYNGEIEEEIKKLGPHLELTRKCCLGSHCHVLEMPLSQERQWKVFKMINLLDKKAPFLKKMGLLPCVKGMAQKAGALLQ